MGFPLPIPGTKGFEEMDRKMDKRFTALCAKIDELNNHLTSLENEIRLLREALVEK